MLCPLTSYHSDATDLLPKTLRAASPLQSSQHINLDPLQGPRSPIAELAGERMNELVNE